MEEPSRIHCCRGNIFWMRVYSLSHPACKTHMPYYIAIWLCYIFPRYLINGTFLAKLCWRKIMFWFSLQHLYVTCLILRGIQRDTIINVGTAVAQWLRCCATSRKVAGSIPAVVIGIFHWHNPSDRTMAPGSTHPLSEMSTRSISWEQRRPVRKANNLTTILCRCHVIWEPSWNPLGHSRPVTGLLYLYYHKCTYVFMYSTRYYWQILVKLESLDVLTL